MRPSSLKCVLCVVNRTFCCWSFFPVSFRFYDYLLKRTTWQNSSGTFNCSHASDLTGAARVACLREVPTEELMKMSARNYQDTCKDALSERQAGR